MSCLICECILRIKLSETNKGDLGKYLEVYYSAGATLARRGRALNETIVHSAP